MASRRSRLAGPLRASRGSQPAAGASRCPTSARSPQTSTPTSLRTPSTTTGLAGNVLRGIDVYPEKTRDDIHFARAAKEQRVLVSNDIDTKMLAERSFLEGRSYRGLVWWPRSHYAVMGPRDFVAAFEELAARDDPFATYPIVHIKPRP
jgi:hypothetical protein